MIDSVPNQAPMSAATATKTHLGRLGRSSVARLILLDLLLFAGMSVAMPHLFLTSTNLQSMAVQLPAYGLFALAMTLPMITGGIDLSIISLSNLVSIVAALTLRKLFAVNDVMTLHGIAVVLAVCTGALALAAVGGLINGFFIGRVGMPPILATLGSGLVFLGIALVITDGAAVVGLPAAFDWIGSGRPMGVPVSAWLFVVVAVVIGLALTKTAFGARVYLFGTNPLAARFAGIDTCNVLYKTYATSAVCAALAGLVIAAGANSAKADYGGAYLLQSILVCVLGGVSPFGGVGRITGVVLAVFALQCLSTGLNLMGASNFLAEAVWGIVLLATMALGRALDPEKR